MLQKYMYMKEMTLAWELLCLASSALAECAYTHLQFGPVVIPSGKGSLGAHCIDLFGSPMYTKARGEPTGPR
jgi:hypothetical protein